MFCGLNDDSGINCQHVHQRIIGTTVRNASKATFLQIINDDDKPTFVCVITEPATRNLLTNPTMI